MRYAVNGYLFSQRQTGVMRLAREILIRVDQTKLAEDICLVVPEYADKVPPLERIRIIRYGSLKSNLWEQISFPRFINRHHYICINFNNTKPLFSKGITFIHDLAYVVHPEYASSLHGKLSNLYHRILYRQIAQSGDLIITDSYFSKQQIIEQYHVAQDRIKVIRAGWEHMGSVQPDDAILNTLHLIPSNYYFTLGSISAMKNTKWVLKVAEKHPKTVFVIAGAQSLSDGLLYKSPENVIMTGYIRDEEIVALIKNCKAFLYPSFYEGFGIPPLEALSLGASVICSISAPLPEIYKSSVRYIDPYEPDVNLDKLLREPVSNSNDILSNYTWENGCADFCTAILSVQ